LSRGEVEFYNFTVSEALRVFKRVVFVTYLVILHVFAAIFLYQTFLPNGFRALTGLTPAVSDPAKQPEAPTPLPVPSEFVETSNANDVGSNTNTSSAAPTLYEAPSGLMVPVAGIKPEQLVDTFSQSRSEGRVHDAIDIMAPGGSPVIATADGTIVKFFDSQRGGITIYEISADKKYFYYYAHLQRRADNLHEGEEVKKGTLIGYVGDTGNAGPGNYHLHFAISIVTDPKRFWDGQPINPYPLLRGAQK
jgi:murein DD-endopeptidase MepM/ murein hydrolase activator NlpD